MSRQGIPVVIVVMNRCSYLSSLYLFSVFRFDRMECVCKISGLSFFSRSEHLGQVFGF